MQVPWQAIFHCGGSRVSMAHSVTTLCPGSRAPWARHIPAPRFGSSMLPPGLFQTQPICSTYFVSQLLTHMFPPWIYFCNAVWPLPAGLAGSCWQAGPLPSAILESSSDLQGVRRTVLTAFRRRLNGSGQATCLYRTVQGCQSHTHRICLGFFLSLRHLCLCFTGTTAPLNESVYALIYAELNHQHGSGESFPKGKLLSFPSETGYNFTFTAFFLNDKLYRYQAPAAPIKNDYHLWELQISQALSPDHPARLYCSSCNLPRLTNLLLLSYSRFFMISFHSSTSWWYSTVITGVRTGVNSGFLLDLFFDVLFEIYCHVEVLLPLSF